MRRTLIFFSVGLTIFSLMTVGGLIKAVQVIQQSSTPVVQAQVVFFQPLPTAAENSVPVTDPTAEPTPLPVVVEIKPDQAAQFGVQAAAFDETVVSTPEKVIFNLIVAYEVVFDDSNLVYVDASSGALLYNSLTGDNTPSVSLDQAIAIAQQFTGDGRVYSTYKKDISGMLVYEIRFANNDRARVNARGEVVYAYFAWTAPDVPVAQPASAPSNPSPSGNPPPNSDSEPGGEHD
jgi:hypothetical protein